MYLLCSLASFRAKISNEVKSIYSPASAAHQFNLLNSFGTQKFPSVFLCKKVFHTVACVNCDLEKNSIFIFTLLSIGWDPKLQKDRPDFPTPDNRCAKLNIAATCPVKMHQHIEPAMKRYLNTGKPTTTSISKTPCMEIQATKNCFQYYRTGEVKNPWDEDLKSNPEISASLTQQGGDTQV